MCCHFCCLLGQSWVVFFLNETFNWINEGYIKKANLRPPGQVGPAFLSIFLNVSVASYLTSEYMNIGSCFYWNTICGEL